MASSASRHSRRYRSSFAEDYREHLPRPIDTDADASTILDRLTSAVSRTPYKLYLLIDEYDNFVNEVMVKDVETYKALFEADGPYKERVLGEEVEATA